MRLTVLDDGRVAVGMTYWSSELCDAPAEFRLIDPATGEVGPELARYSTWAQAFDLTTDGTRLVAAMALESRGIHVAEIPLSGGVIEAGASMCANQ